MKNKKNRSKALKMFFLLVTLVVTMGVMTGCGKEENTSDSENDTTEVVDATATEDTEEPVSEDAEDPVEVEEPEIEDKETETPVEVVAPEEVSEDSEETESTEEREVISMENPDATLEEFIEYINTFDITETVILCDDYIEARYVLYNGDSCEINYLVPHLNVYSPGKEIVEGHVYGESGEELQGLFLYVSGTFELCVDDYYEGDVCINVEYSDGTTEELTVHFVDVYNQ